MDGKEQTTEGMAAGTGWRDRVKVRERGMLARMGMAAGAGGREVQDRIGEGPGRIGEGPGRIGEGPGRAVKVQDRIGEGPGRMETVPSLTGARGPPAGKPIPTGCHTETLPAMGMTGTGGIPPRMCHPGRNPPPRESSETVNIPHDRAGP